MGTPLSKSRGSKRTKRRKTEYKTAVAKRKAEPPEPHLSKREQRRELNKQRHRELEEVRQKALKDGLVEHGLSPEESLQRLVDDATLRYITEVALNAQRRAQGVKVSDTRERALAKEAAYFDGLAIQYRLYERQTVVQESRVTLMAGLVQLACRRLEVPEDTVRAIPGVILELLEEAQNGGGPPELRKALVVNVGEAVDGK